MTDIFVKGGLLMYPLLIASFFALAIIIERIIIFSGNSINPRFFNDVKGLLSRSYKILPEKINTKQKGPLKQIITDILEMKNQPREKIEKHVSALGDIYLHMLEKHLHILELIGRMAPMTGLLGTVVGMVAAFKQIASVQTIVDPSILAGGIWEALITTVFGLIVGIPSLIAHHLFTEKIGRIAFYLKNGCEDIIYLIKDSDD